VNARALRLIPIALLAALTLFAAVVVPVSLDSGSFMYMGRLLTSGGVPYLDAWDHKGPLMYVWNAAALLLGGDTPRGVLVVEAALTALALGWSMRRWARLIGDRDATIVGGTLVLAYAMFWSSGDLSETVYFPAQLMAYTALLHCAVAGDASDRDVLWAGVFVGIAAAIGVGTRINNAMGLVAAAGLFVLWRRTRAFGFVLASILTAALVLVPVLLLFRSRGALSEMWDQYWIFNTKFNTTTVPPAARLANGWFLFLLYARTPLAFVTAAGALLLVRSGVRRPNLLLVLGAGLVMLEFAAQLISGQGFRHYLVTTLASLAVYAVLLRAPLAAAPDSVCTIWPRHAISRLVAVALIAFWGLSTWRAVDAMKVRAYQGSSVGDASLAQVARAVRARAPEGAPIYGSGNFGAVLAVTHHPSSSRYFNDYPLLVTGYGPRHVRILATELLAKPPAVIVRVPGTCPIMEPGPECMPASVTLAAFARGHYTLDTTIGDYEVWVRNTP
jgi:hypothetical protein